MARLVRLAVFGVVVMTQSLSGQQDPVLRAAQSAYESLDYGAAIAAARRAMNRRLSHEERIVAYELLGFGYGALDSTRQAVAAFRELIFLAPDREPDPIRVSPRITSLYASALGQVLVVRKVRVDSVSFVAGRGTVPVRFDVTRPAQVVTRAAGSDLDIRIDSLRVADEGGVLWSALGDDGRPVPAGRYQLIIEASAGRDEYASQVLVEVRHGQVDTLSHLTSVPGYELVEEYETPDREWRPLGLAALYAAIASGASLALENTALGSPSRREIGAVNAAVLLTGFVMSLRRPDPRPVDSNILYNQLLREELARRNADIARENENRRRQVMVTVVPVAGGSP